jgi:predicted permease
MRLLRRIAYWFRLSRHQSELSDELAHHRELLAANFERQGMSPQAAGDAARRELGNATYMKEEARGVWLSPRLEALAQDFRYAWRGLRRSPAFTVVATLSLALGIGANAAIFGLIHSLLLARLPVPAAIQLVEVQRDLGAKGIDDRVTPEEFRALAAAHLPLTAFTSQSASIDIDGFTIDASMDAVAGGYFDLLELRGSRGRLLSALDAAGSAPVVVVSDRFWHARLNSDAAVAGKVVKVNGHPVTIVGVTPPRFAGLRFGWSTDVFMPYETAAALGIIRVAPRAPMLAVVGRREPGRSLDVTRADLATIWNRCCASGQLVNGPNGLTLASRLGLIDVSRGIPVLKFDLRAQYSRILLALMGGVAILLLAACANVANLLLARGSARIGELAVRLSLGASRRRLIFQLMIESLQLSLLGAAFGLILARWGSLALVNRYGGDLAKIASPSIAPAVLGFAVLISLLSGALFGVVPAVRVMRSDLVTPLKQGARRSSSGRRGRLDRTLVGFQMALALLLVSGAAMFVGTLRNLRQIDLGFDPSRRLVLSVETRRTAYAPQGMTVQMVDEMLRQVRAMPGVASAAFASFAPVYGGRATSDNVTVPGSARREGDDVGSSFSAVTPEYFSSLGIRLLEGRDVGPPTPVMGATRDVVVNDKFAKKFFPGGNAIGQTFDDADEGDTVGTHDHIVGVVASVTLTSQRGMARPMYFVPVNDGDWPYLVLVIKPSPGATVTGASVAKAIGRVAPGIRQSEAALLSASVDEALLRERLAATLAALFGGIALALVAVGLYGVMLYQVTERTAEIGIRMALGADRSRVTSLVMRQSLTIVTLGIVAGLPLSVLAGRAVASQLYGVSPYSMWTLSIATVSLVGVAILATLVPLRRAVTIDPLKALRSE